MKNYTIISKSGTIDHTEQVSSYLTGIGIDNSISDGVFGKRYVMFKARKKVWKRIKKDLNLVVDDVWCIIR